MSRIPARWRFQNQRPFGALQVFGRDAFGIRSGPSGKQRRFEEAAAALFHADVRLLCNAGRRGTYGEPLDEMLAAPGHCDSGVFPTRITHTYFSHAEMERAN